MDESTFIQALASRLARPTPVHPPTAVNIDLPLVPPATPDAMIAAFLGNWQTAGGKGAVVRSISEATLHLKTWLGSELNNLAAEPAIIGWGDLSNFAKATFTNLGYPITPYSKNLDLAELSECSKLGITGADWGIVQSGTLVNISNQHRGRVVSLLPPKHLAFLPINSLRDNLNQVMAELMKLSPSAAIEFITGPSRSADIEMDLSIGVHGPKEVFVLLYPADLDELLL